ELGQRGHRRLTPTAGSGEVCRDFLVTVRALFLRTRGMVGVLGFHRVLRGPPPRQPTAQRPGLAALLSEELRHTGAGALVGSSAVGDDLAVGGEALEVPQDLGSRARGLENANERFGRDPNRARDAVA